MQESVPESGSTVAGGEGESITILCRVLNENTGGHRMVSPEKKW